MKKLTKRLAVMGMAAVMAATLLSGCGMKKATPDNLLQDMAANAEKTKSVLMNMKFEMNMADETDSVSISMDMDMESTADPEASYGKGSVNLGMSGSSVGTEMEMYTAKEGDQYVTYTLAKDEWTKDTADAGDVLGNVGSMTGNIADYADKFELEKSLADVNGKKCFELTGELSGDIFTEMLQSNMMDSFSGYGLDEEAVADMVFPCTIDVYKDSVLPARLYFDLAPAFEPMLAEAEVTASDCYIEMTFLEYDSVDEIVVPDEALSAGESGDSIGDIGGSVESAEPAERNPELGDDWESYTVQINDKVVTLPCTIADLEAAGVTLDASYTPEDYAVNAGEYELAWFVDDNGNEIMVDMVNNTDGALELKDCQVGGISVDSYDLKSGGLTVLFPGGIQIGSAGADAIAAYGEPDSTYEDDEYGNSYHWYAENSYDNSCDIDTEAGTGLVDSMSIDCHAKK